MIRVTITTVAAGSFITLQDPFPTDGKLVIKVPPDGGSVTQDMTNDQYLRIKPYLDRYRESGALATVLVNDLEAERSDEWVELQERVAKVATVATTGTTPPPNLVALGVRKGDVFVVYDHTTTTYLEYPVVAVHAATIFEATIAVVAFNKAVAGDSYYFTRSGTEITGTRRTVNGPAVTHVVATVSETPFRRTDFGKFFVKSVDGKPYFLMSNGTELNVGMTGSDPLVFKGTIAVAADFPLPAPVVQNGWLYLVTADVTDNDGTRTNTGQSFMAGAELAWNGADWSELGTERDVVYYDDDTVPLDITDGNILALINSTTGFITVNLPAAGPGTVNKTITVVDVAGTAGVTNDIGVIPQAADSIDGAVAGVGILIDQAYGAFTLTGVLVEPVGPTYGWSTTQRPELLAATARLVVIGAGTQNVESFQHMPATEDLRLLRAKAAGVITGIHAECGTTLGVAETMSFDVIRRRGPAGAEVEMLLATIDFIEAQAVDAVVDGGLIAAPLFEANDLLFARRVYVAGAGMLRDTVVGVQVRYN